MFRFVTVTLVGGHIFSNRVLKEKQRSNLQEGERQPCPRCQPANYQSWTTGQRQQAAIWDRVYLDTYNF